MNDEIKYYKRAVIGFIAVRLALFLIGLVAPLVKLLNTYNSYNSVLTILSFIPLVWLLPLFMIIRDYREGYSVARVFSVILAILSFVGIFYIVVSVSSGILSVLSLVTAVIIYIASGKALAAWEVESVKHPLIVNDTRALITKIVFAVAAGVATVLPSFFFIGLLINNRLSMTATSITAIVLTALAAAYVGFYYAQKLVDALKIDTANAGTIIFGGGALAGGICGALANIPLYAGPSFPILIIAMPVGFTIGVPVGIVGAVAASSLARPFLKA